MTSRDRIAAREVALGLVLVALAACSGTPADADESTTAGPTTDEPTTGQPVVCGQSGIAEALLTTDTPGAAAGGGVGAGDLDGDGVLDVAIGSPGGWRDAVTFVPGVVDVLLGPVEAATGALGDGPGFRIVAEHTDERIGAALTVVGDMNGDGRSELVVGETQACWFDPDGEICDTDSECPDPICTTGPYRTYVVFGRADGAEVSLADVALGEGGFAIDGETTDDLRAQELVDLGDLNGDGRSDFALAAQRAADGAGALYVIHGKADGNAIDLADVATGVGGHAIRASSSDDYGFPDSIAGLGDFDGDGLGDLAIGHTNAYEGMGAVWVVLGKADTTAVELADVDDGMGGFVVRAEQFEPTPWCCSDTGRFVAAAGDVDGDGRADLALSAPSLDVTHTDQGRAYVVFGKADGMEVELAAIAAGDGGGFAIDGTWDTGSWLAGGGGDRDGDGLADIVVGGSDAQPYLVLGKADATTVVLGSAGAPAITPATPGPWYAGPQSSLPDVDCDDRADLLLGTFDYAGTQDSAVLFVLE